MRRMTSKSSDAMTLIEILVAMGIFLFLGVALIGMLRGGLSTWRAGESKREVLERAQTVLTQLSADLRSVYTNPPKGQSVKVKFIADISPETDMPVLRLVRTISGEVQPFIRREAGSLIRGNALIDENSDRYEAFKGYLKPSGGLCEVAYILVPDNTAETAGQYILYRGIRSPIGDSAGSVFLNLNATVGAAKADMRPLCKGVMYLGYSFWTQYTDTWNPAYYTKTYLERADDRSGPLPYWDSTRGYIIDNEDTREWEYSMYRGTPSDPSDDVFPSAVRVTLVLSERKRTAVRSQLVRDLPLADNTEQIRLRDAAKFPYSPDEGYCFVKIDDEWIEYAERSGDMLTGIRRGARGTAIQAHDRGAVVETGKTISFVVSLPSFREDWDE